MLIVFLKIKIIEKGKFLSIIKKVKKSRGKDLKFDRSRLILLENQGRNEYSDGQYPAAEVEKVRGVCEV